MAKEIIILQFSRRFDICSFIKEAMIKTHPELLEQTKFFNCLEGKSGARSHIITPKKNILKKREGKDMLIITGSVLMDENGNEIIRKIAKWNPKAEIIVYSSNTENISQKKSGGKQIIDVIEKHNTPEHYEELVKTIYKIATAGFFKKTPIKHTRADFTAAFFLLKKLAIYD